jgi:hypothetical protein
MARITRKRNRIFSISGREDRKRTSGKDSSTVASRHPFALMILTFCPPGNRSLHFVATPFRMV